MNSVTRVTPFVSNYDDVEMFLIIRLNTIKGINLRVFQVKYCMYFRRIFLYVLIYLSMFIVGVVNISIMVQDTRHYLLW